jgi:hypothetical protein
MAKSTPHFNDMMAARGGMGHTAKPAAGKKMPAPPKAAKPAKVADTDNDRM